jgi:hypothetical protein
MTNTADPWGPYRATIEDHLGTCADYLSRLRRSPAGEIASDRHYFADKAHLLHIAARRMVRGRRPRHPVDSRRPRQMSALIGWENSWQNSDRAIKLLLTRDDEGSRAPSRGDLNVVDLHASCSGIELPTNASLLVTYTLTTATSAVGRDVWFVSSIPQPTWDPSKLSNDWS